MINKTFIPVNGLKKEPYSGCHNGMRYYMCSTEDKSEFTVTVYPEPWCLEKTPDEMKETKNFPINEAGMDAAIEWLFEKYNEKTDFWTDSLENAMHNILK